MGVLNLSRLMSKQRQRRRRQIYARNRWVASRAKRKGSPSQQDDKTLGSQIKGHSGPSLPEDIWCFIHSLMPMRDAAQVACVSRAFVRFWRCRTKLDFSQGTLLGLNKNACQKDKARYFNNTIDSILRKHSGIGLKALKFDAPSVYNGDGRHLAHMDSWLQIALKPGIEELSLRLTIDGNYNFPCSLLSGRTGDQLWYLSLSCCSFHPTARLCLRSLTRLQLTMVQITTNELGCLLSSSFALEMLELRYCNDIVCLRIPCLQWLSYLEVVNCTSLEAVESKAPNLSSVSFTGSLQVKLLLGETWRIKKLHRHCSNLAFYARTELPSNMPNLEALTIRSDVEKVSTPMVPSKFVHLKLLSIAVGGVTFDCLSLVSFLDAAPSLETFVLEVMRECKKRVSVFEDHSDLRVMPGHHYSKLKHVKIIKFSAAKSVAELTCHILKSATSLECLILDTTHGMPRCSVNKTGKCIFMLSDALVEAQGLLAAKMYIKPNVPSTVEFNVLEPCSRCHAVGL